MVMSKVVVVLNGRTEEKESMGGCGFFFQAEDGIRDAQESRGLGDVYKRQILETFKIQFALLLNQLYADIAVCVYVGTGDDLITSQFLIIP